MSKLFTLLLVILLPFSLSGMEKEKLIPSEEVGDVYSAEDVNADKIVKAFMGGRPIAEIIHLLKTQKININFQVKISDRKTNSQEICTILKCALQRCNPNVKADVEVVALILQQGALLRQQTDADGYWESYLRHALRQAIKNNNNLSIVKLLVEGGADVNDHYINEKGWGNSALHLALMNCKEDSKCIDYLLEKGADVNARNSWGKTPLAILAEPGAWKPGLKLFELVVEKLLEYGADIDKTEMDYDQNPPIEKSNYYLLKPLTSKLDTIIEKVETKKKQKNIVADLKKAAENSINANRLIIISGQTFNLSETVLGARCPNLWLQLNPNYKKETNP